jgi:predicted TIM-barrel fold metal-dependent hydrolase
MRLDGHAHVFLKDLPMASNRRYTPVSDALPETYFGLLSRHGLDGAVLVQPSFLGNDNSYLLDVLDKSQSDPNNLSVFGVCMTEPDVSIDEIQELKTRRIIGVRLNYVKRELPDLQSRRWQSFIARIHESNWLLELHIEADRLLSVLETLPPELNTVVDHFCLAGDENELAEILSRALTFVCCDSLFVKASAPYRLPARGDGIANGALAQALSKVLIDALGAKQVIWGSDWPFTQHERLQDFENCVLQGKQWIAGKSKLLPGFPIHLLG